MSFINQGKASIGGELSLMSRLFHGGGLGELRLLLACNRNKHSYLFICKMIVLLYVFMFIECVDSTT